MKIENFKLAQKNYNMIIQLDSLISGLNNHHAISIGNTRCDFDMDFHIELKDALIEKLNEIKNNAEQALALL